MRIMWSNRPRKVLSGLYHVLSSCLFSLGVFISQSPRLPSSLWARTLLSRDKISRHRVPLYARGLFATKLFCSVACQSWRSNLYSERCSIKFEVASRSASNGQYPLCKVGRYARPLSMYKARANTFWASFLTKFQMQSLSAWSQWRQQARDFTSLGVSGFQPDPQDPRSHLTGLQMVT